MGKQSVLVAVDIAFTAESTAPVGIRYSLFGETKTSEAFSPAGNEEGGDISGWTLVAPPGALDEKD